MPELSRAAVFARATRLKTVPLIIVPVGLGTAFGAARAGRIDWLAFLFAAAGAALAHLAANVFNDVFDQQCDRIAGMDRTAIVTASGLIQTGRLSARAMTALGSALGAGAVAIGIWLGIARGPGALVLASAGAFLALEYSGRPVRYAYLGHGLGELGLVAAFGILPVAGAAYLQLGRFEPDVWWAGVVPGMLTMIAYYHHSLLHHRSDRAVGKRTPGALLGPEGALIASAALIAGMYAALAIQVALGLFPGEALAGMLPVVPLLGAWGRAFRDPAPQHVLNLLGASLGASVLTVAWLAVSLWLF